MLRTLNILILTLVLMSLTACGQQSAEDREDSVPKNTPEAEVWFVDTAADSGLNFVHNSRVSGSYVMPEIVGSGGAMFDYDNDGDLDIYLVSSGSLDGSHDEARNRLYQQSAEGRFLDVTAEAGVGDLGYGMGTAVGDMDNDGDLDLFVSNYGEDRLYRNNGDATFQDVTKEAGIQGSVWSTSAAFCDYDLDGYLDLYVVTYVTNDPPKACTTNSGEPEYCGPKSFRGVADQLYHNQGDGTFSVTDATNGISRTVNAGLGLVCFDFDKDTLPDVFVANDGERNGLWINQGDGIFEDRGMAFGVAVNMFGKPEASMGVAFGDVDGDANLDLFLTHLDKESNTLYTGSSANALTDTTAASGLGAPSLPFTGFGTAFFDADQDSDLDLLIANGRVRKGPDLWHGRASSDLLAGLFRAYAEPNRLFENTGVGKFQDLCAHAGEFCSSVAISRGLLARDIDGDGDLDVLVTNSNAPVQLFRNDVPNKGNWLSIRTMDPELNRDAVGALVSVKMGDKWLVRPVLHTTSYLSSGEATVHFGLGSSQNVDEIKIIWPGGIEERFSGTAGNQNVTFKKGEGDLISTGESS